MVMRRAAEKFCSAISRMSSWIVQEALQFIRQAGGVAGFIEINCQPFIERHLAKVIDSRRYDWDAEFARKVGYAAGSGRGGIRKH